MQLNEDRKVIVLYNHENFLTRFRTMIGQRSKCVAQDSGEWGNIKNS